MKEAKDPIKKKVELGRLDVTFQSGRKDEIGYLGAAFNRLVGRISEMLDENTKLVREVYESKVLQQEAQINALLQQLPEEQHLVLSMVTVQGLSYQETADALGVPLGTVMSRLARARTRLVELVGNDRAYGAVAPTLH